MIWVSVKAFLTKKFVGKSVSVNNWIPAQVPFFNLVQAWATTGADLYDRSFWKKSCFSSNKNLLLWRSNFFLFQNFLSVTQIFKKRQKSCRWAEGGEGGRQGSKLERGRGGGWVVVVVRGREDSFSQKDNTPEISESQMFPSSRRENLSLVAAENKSFAQNFVSLSESLKVKSKQDSTLGSFFPVPC